MRDTDDAPESDMVADAAADPEFEQFAHERHLERACELAEAAAARGDEPFGTVLVRDDEVVAEAKNRVVTDDDVRGHPELDLAAEAVRAFTPDERARTVMYTSTEPCPMCSGGLRYAGLGRVVYSVGSDEVAAFTGRGEPTVRSAEILDGVTEVVGPVANDRGRRVHEAYGWNEE